MLKRLASLGNGITTDKQLESVMKHLPGFKGVFDRVEFFKIYPQMRAGDSVILNLDPNYSRNGTHWVALKISHDGNMIFYKDSFGAPPSEDFYRNLGRTVLYGTKIYQGINEQNCGRYAAEFLTALITSGRNDKKMFERIA
jgi:hypothetical protein